MTQRNMMKRNLFHLLCASFVLGMLVLIPSRALAQDPQPTPSDNEVNRLAKQMYCPVCENIPLDVCPTQACQEWRDLIRLRMSQGWSDQQIKDYFAAQYGDRVLAAPPARGLNLIVYLLPVVAFLVGAVIVYRVITSMRRKTQTIQPASPAAGASGPHTSRGPQLPDDPYLARFEEEAKKKE